MSFRTTNAGELNGTGYVHVVPGPPAGTFEIADGGLVVHNADATDRVFTIEIRKGATTVLLYNDIIAAGESLIWEDVLRLPDDFTGIFIKLDGAPATQPTWYYTGRLG